MKAGGQDTSGSAAEAGTVTLGGRLHAAPEIPRVIPFQVTATYGAARLLSSYRPTLSVGCEINSGSHNPHVKNGIDEEAGSPPTPPGPGAVLLRGRRVRARIAGLAGHERLFHGSRRKSPKTLLQPVTELEVARGSRRCSVKVK